MSYILDALKKSEYARQQGKVPDLATLPVVDTLTSAPPAFARLPLLAAGALLLAVAVAGWWRPWQAPAAPLPSSPVAAASLSASPVVSAPALASAPAPTPAPTPTSASPGPIAAPPGIPVVEPVAVAVAPAQIEPPPLAALPVERMPPPAPKAVLPALAPQPSAPKTLPSAAHEPLAATPRPSAAPASALPAPPSRVLAFYELPPAVRERIPALAISGFSYVEEPGMRMAVINDRVLRQGESAAPGITLERIASDGVVLNFSGYRFRPQR